MKRLNKSEHTKVFRDHMKVIKIGPMNEMLTESKALELLSEVPSVPKFLDLTRELGSKDQSNLNLIREYVPGKPLSQTTVKDKHEFLRNLYSILVAINSYGVIHNNLTPDNIILTEDEVVYLIDFSKATIDKQTAITKSNDFIGVENSYLTIAKYITEGEK